MAIDRTLSTLINWGDARANEGSRPLLQVEGSALTVVHETRFLERTWNRVLSFFGVGNRALANVLTVAEKALHDKGSAIKGTQRKKLERAVRLLNEKADRYKRKLFLGIFPLPRVKIGKGVSFSSEEPISTEKVKKKLSVKVKKQAKPATSSVPIPKAPSYAKSDIDLPKKVKKKEPVQIKKVQEKKPEAVVKPALATKVVSRRGIANEGNTCFAAATLQALYAVHPKLRQGVLRSFYDELSESERHPPKRDINTLLRSLDNVEWKHVPNEEGDPVTFYEDALIKELQGVSSRTAMLHQKVSSLPAEASMQKIVTGAYLKKGFDFGSPSPAFFAVSLEGRRQSKDGDETYSEAPVSIESRVMVGGGENKVPYRLGSVVMYASHHYYALEPVYDAAGYLQSWIRYNDSVVSQIPHSQKVEKDLERFGYLFFYTQTV